jgi:hypothetical protein
MLSIYPETLILSSFFFKTDPAFLLRHSFLFFLLDFLYRSIILIVEVREMCYLKLVSGGTIQKHCQSLDDALRFAKTLPRLAYGEWCGEKLPL